MAHNPELEIRSSRPGEEAQVVELMNAVFEGQETVESWLWTMGHSSATVNENAFIAQDKRDGRIVGVVCLSLKPLLLPEGRSIMIGETGGGAVSPTHRGMGIYGRVHDMALKAGYRRGIPVILSWLEKGAVAYTHCLRVDFVDTQLQPTLMKILNYERVFPSKFRRVIGSRPRLATALDKFPVPIILTIGHVQHPLEEVLGWTPGATAESKRRIEIIFTEQSYLLLVRLLNARGWVKIAYLAWMWLTGKLKVKFSSAGAFIASVRGAPRVLRYI